MISRLPYESVFSYLVRFSQSNCLDLLSLWNYCKADSFASRKDIQLLNFSPKNIIDLEKLSDLTDLSMDEILEMSFHNLLKKFSYGGGETSHSKVMKGMLHDKYHYCQKCLQETPYHQYLWSLKDVDMCYKHKTQLMHICNHCGRIIRLRDVSYFDQCPYCEQNLADDMIDISPKPISTEEQGWVINNFIYLNKNNGMSISCKDLVMKILYIINGFEPVFKQEALYRIVNGNVETVYNLLRRARDTYKQYLQLAFVMKVLYQNRFTFEQLFNINISKEFCDSVVQRKAHLEVRLTCLAPWCSKTGAFLKTGTHYKRNAKGEFNYYLICRECGSRFGVDYNNELVDLTEFIGIYRYLSSIKDKRISLMRLSTESGYTFSILRKAVAYFESRGVLTYENYKVEFSDERLQSVLTAMIEGETLNNIGRWSIWSRHYEFLYYRYHKEVLTLELSKIKVKEIRRPRLQQDKLELLILPALETMMIEDEDITINNVCRKANINPTALRLYGGNPIVAEMKQKQAISRRNALVNNIRLSIEQYFKNNCSSLVSSAALYNYIGIDRVSVWKISPEVTAPIKERIILHNKLIKQQSL